MKNALLLLMSLMSFGLFAGGDQEDVRGPREWKEGTKLTREAVELTGTIQFDQAFPTFVVQDTRYELMAPRRAYDDLEVSEGSTATMKGFSITLDDGEGNSKTLFHPISGTIDGKSFELPQRGHRGRGPEDFPGPQAGNGPQGMRGQGMGPRGPF
jgi:hypothetical protein